MFKYDHPKGRVMGRVHKMHYFGTGTVHCLPNIPSRFLLCCENCFSWHQVRPAPLQLVSGSAGLDAVTRRALLRQPSGRGVCLSRASWDE